ncbi:helix-turn-helix domain-containing protein [Roseateles cavernae]|uniref:helix-turn-helix domain-containing protein n=1 Tax=Roseateles cavernae TaxID=3153578 RepID=UPI0032E41F66
MSQLNIAPSVQDPQVVRELHEFAQELGKSISIELRSHLDDSGGKGVRIEQTLGDLFPHILEKHFFRAVGTKGAAITRARLLHALSVLNLQSLDEDDDEDADEGESEASGLPVAVAAAPAQREPFLDESLTSAQAAELLNVSRTYFNVLADSGKLGAVERTEGGHRRVSKSVVLAYKAESRRKQEKAISDMVEASQELGLYDDEMEGIPQRKVR